MAEGSPRRSALLFALDTSGGHDIVYRVAVYLQELVRQLVTAPGFTTRARIDLLVGDASRMRIVSLDSLLGQAAAQASQAVPSGLSLPMILEQARGLPFEGGGFHLFVLMTRDLAPGWEREVPALHAFLASVTGLCCGPYAPDATARTLSKEPGGIRVVNPLDTIRVQFDSIAAWLIDNFADRPALPPPAPPEPLVSKTPSRAQWKVREPADPADPTPHEDSQARPGSAGWQLVAASRRGKLHAHEALYRDDAFALGQTAGWNLIAVADGAGSCRLSRVGARISTDAAVAGMASALSACAGLPWSGNGAEADGVRQITTAGLQSAHAAVFAEAQRRQIPVRDLSATLLLIAHCPPDDLGVPHRLAVAQVGDGAILAVDSDDQFHWLGEAKKGFYAGETTFLTGVAAADLASCARAYTFPEVRLALAMTDGIADDMYPAARLVPELARGILDNVRPHADPAAALLKFIAYEKNDSSDDRTLAVLYRQSGGR